MLVTGYFALWIGQVMCAEFSQCYYDVSRPICLWTDGVLRTQSVCQSLCQQRDRSFLPRITNSDLQSRLVQFRDVAPRSLVGGSGIWIDVTSTGISNLHWLDRSPLAGLFRLLSTSRLLLSVSVTT